MERNNGYHKTKDIYHFKRTLEHNSITNTEIYINIEQAPFLTENSEYYPATANTTEEALKLIETGFKYATEITEQNY